MLFGRSIVSWLIILFVVVCVFFLAQFFIPLVFNAVGLHLPANIVNILAALIAAGVAFGWYSRPVA